MSLDHFLQTGPPSQECQQVHLTESSRIRGHPIKNEKFHNDNVALNSKKIIIKKPRLTRNSMQQKEHRVKQTELTIHLKNKE